ncbi:Arylsulfatase [Sedimentisphaera cyanobacteriorum]|uniref:Arylsulfatase n=1 Tax=Sedimentisphaera cyanobacteriorum TaxID=1940790 RepID=A0A1Q2HLZ2_9BACT|nr:sulfatase-like hydrolase/transferase [Sedimentisphaera cyanobacteriorum]AQQ08274.1 Arylsulfatase [Sedimentisphaera cyanobacteriorum]
MNRRHFVKSCGLGAFLAASGVNLFAAENDRPNILWLTSEDNSPYLGCYGDENAKTPNLDKLGCNGVRFRNAFANAPVCSVARSTLITGMYASSLGLQNHRSSVEIPRGLKTYGELLQQAGYYCTNNKKTDYNFPWSDRNVWDKSSWNAHYKNKPAGNPFMAVFNTTISHEGQITDARVKQRRDKGLIPKTPRLGLSEVKLPPYYPDTEEIRYNVAVYYDNMTLMDKWIGDKLEELKKSGEAENTIIFYYGDHGGALPRGKRNIHDSGTRVPFIVYFPEKWKHLAPVEPGQWCEDVVTFADFPATVLSLAGVKPPENYEGRAFLGKYKQPKRDYAYLYRNRMDERYDAVRAVRTEKWRYIRNFSPHRPWGQQYGYPFRVQNIMGLWYEQYKQGKCSWQEARYWQKKPGREMYFIPDDPHEMNNLAYSVEYVSKQRELEEKLKNEIVKTRDTGFIPEGMFEGLAEKYGTIYDFAQSKDYQIQRIAEIAEIASDGDPEKMAVLEMASGDKCPIIRYWAATGYLILGKKARPHIQTIQKLLKDESLDVRIPAAETLLRFGENSEAAETLKDACHAENYYHRLAAANSVQLLFLEGFMDKAKTLSLMQNLPEKKAGGPDWVNKICSQIKST